MLERAKGVIRKVTLEVIYEVVEERAREIRAEIKELKDRQEQDFRYLNQRIDQLGQKIDEQVGQVRHEIGQLRGEINQLRQEIRREIGQPNHRIDTVIQMLPEIMRK